MFVKVAHCQFEMVALGPESSIPTSYDDGGKKALGTHARQGSIYSLLRILLHHQLLRSGNLAILCQLHEVDTRIQGTIYCYD